MMGCGRIGVVLLGVMALCCGEVRGAATRDDFLFELRTALKTRDWGSLVACFEFEGAEPGTEKALWKALEQLLTWPTHHIQVTERSGSGAFFMRRDGRRYTLNGDWRYQIHIHVRPPPSRGYVFPVGVTPEGRHAILLTIPASEG